MTKNVTAAYEAKEEATQRKPAELYHVWKLSEDIHYRYTSGDIAVTYNGDAYTPATIERDEIQYDASLDNSSLTIKAARITTPFIEYLAVNPLDLYWIEVLKLFRDQAPLEASVAFVGQIKTISFKGITAQINCVGFETYLQRNVPRFRYSPGCNWTLFDSKCTIDKTLYSTNAVLTDLSVDGLTLTSATFALEEDGYYTYGYAEFGDARRMITSHIADVVKLNYKIPDLVNGDTVTVYAGCDGDIKTCFSKFNNVVNHGGHSYIPVDNPATVMK